MYIKKQEKQQDVLIKALDVFLICPVVLKKGADVLKASVVKCEHILMYILKDISCCSRKIYNLTPVTLYMIDEDLSNFPVETVGRCYLKLLPF